MCGLERDAGKGLGPSGARLRWASMDPGRLVGSARSLAHQAREGLNQRGKRLPSVVVEPEVRHPHDPAHARANEESP